MTFNRAWLFLVVAVAVAMSACSKPKLNVFHDAGELDMAPSSLDDADVVSSDADVIVQDAARDAASARPCEEGACDITWAPLANYDTGVFDHSSFVVEYPTGARFYVAGGLDMFEGLTRYQFYSASAPIAADGSLGEWEHEGADTGLPWQAMTVVHGRSAYIIGGMVLDNEATNETAATTFTLHMHFDTDATIDKYRYASGAARLPHGVVFGSAVFFNGKIVVTGGRPTSFGAGLNSVYVATLDAQGDIVSWSAGPSLPANRSRHCAIVHKGRIYIVGGTTSSSASGWGDATDILRSTTDGAGNLTGWEVVGSLPSIAGSGVADASGFSRGDSLWLVGGRMRMPPAGFGTSSEYSSVAVQRIAIDDDGLAAPSVIVPHGLPIPRSDSSAGTPIIGDRIYILGGITSGSASSSGYVPSSSIFVGTFR